MTVLIARLMTVGVLVLMTGVTAFADPSLRVDIPFTFHTANATMSPGEYHISAINKADPVRVYTLRHMESGRTVAVMTGNGVYRKPSEQHRAEVAFRCFGEYCALATIYTPWRSIGGRS